jgi:hypothetical protein
MLAQHSSRAVVPDHTVTRSLVQHGKSLPPPPLPLPPLYCLCRKTCSIYHGELLPERTAARSYCKGFRHLTPSSPSDNMHITTASFAVFRL